MGPPFSCANQAALADDHHGSPVFLARNDWRITSTAENWPLIRFRKTKEPVR